MKAIKLICGLLFVATICGSCKKDIRTKEPVMDVQYLLLSFKDAQGNDLVKGIKFDAWHNGGYVTGGDDDIGGTVNSGIFILNLAYDDEVKRFSSSLKIDLIKGGFEESYFTGIKNDDNDDLLFIIPALNTTRSEKKVTLKLKCSYLFGDDAVHDIVTWWKPEENMRKSFCYRIEYGGKEFTGIDNVKTNPHFSIATIILNK